MRMFIRSYGLFFLLCYAMSFFKNALSVFCLYSGLFKYLILYGVKCWDDSMNTTLEGRERYHLWPNLRYYPGIFLEGMRKTTKTSTEVVSDPAEIWNG
jgi:hypothetical protein